MDGLRRRDRLGFRLFKGGLPAIMASGSTAFVPILGAFFLSTENYAIWALGAAVATIFVVFDFGAPSLATKLAGNDQLNRATCIRLAIIAMVPPLLLGVIAVAVWPSYRVPAGLESEPMDAAIWMFVLISVGCTLRSVGLVLAASALGAQRFLARGCILMFGALAQLMVTLVGLLFTWGIVSLGLGVLASGVVQVMAGWYFEFRQLSAREMDRDVEAHVKALTVTFVRARGLITVIALAVTQLDRWALGLVGDPALLAQYDIATRLLVIPKVALLAFGAGLIVEGTRAPSYDAVLSLLSKANRAMLAVVPAAMLVAGTVGYFALHETAPSISPLLLCAILATAHALHCLTIPSGYILTGLGKPGYELRYLIPLAALVFGVYGFSVATGSGMSFVVGWGASVSICSLFFVLKGRSYVKESFSRRAFLGGTVSQGGRTLSRGSGGV